MIMEKGIWVSVFRTGMHTDSNGATRTWTHKDLDKIASKYNPSEHEAPVVIGHPRENSPAWGWVESLKREGDTLYAKLKGLVPEFLEMLKKGLFKKRSISLYPDMTLRHIGFLGAVPPAVKGLPDFAFKDAGADALIGLEFEESNQRKEDKGMSFVEKLKAFLKGEGLDVSDIPDTKTFGEKEVKEQIASALKAKEAEFAEREAELKKKEDALRAKEAETRKKSISEFCEGLLKEGRLTPAMMKQGIESFMEAIAESGKTYEFSEGGDPVSCLEFMQSFLGALPKQIHFGEVAGKDKDMGAGGDEAKREKLVSDYIEKNKGCSYKDAVVAVSKEHPEMFER